MSPTWATFFFEAANFLLLAALLGWLFFRPVRDAIAQRQAKLEEAGRLGEEAQAEASRVVAEAEAKRRDLESSLEELRTQLRDEAERERQRIVQAGREQIQHEREALKAEMAATRRGQVRASLGDAAGAARAIAERVLQRIEGPDLEAALVGAARRELAVLARRGALGDVVVESATPLDPPALATLAQAAGVPADQVAQRLVPDLLAGLRVLTSRGLVDASVSGMAAHVEQALARRLESEERAGG